MQLRGDHLSAVPPLLLSTTLALWRMDAHSTTTRLGNLGSAEGIAAAERFLNVRFAPASTRLPEVPVLQAWLGLWRTLMPALSLAALAAWLACLCVAGLRPRQLPALWFVAAVLLALAAARVALVTVLHATALPGAFALRFLSPAQPLWAGFVVLALLGGWQAWREARRPEPSAPNPLPPLR